MNTDKTQLPDHTTAKINWDAWLRDFNAEMINRGYRKYNQHIQNEDFSYCKTVKEKYLLAVMVYDFRKFADRDEKANRIGLQYQVYLTGNHRIDMIISKRISIDEFEAMAEKFYQAMKHNIDDL